MDISKQLIINKTENGKVFTCPSCNSIHIEFKNLNLNFSEAQYEHFAKYIMNLDGKVWEKKNENTLYERKIIIPIEHKNFNILLNIADLEEFKILLNNSRNRMYIQTKKKSDFIFFTYLS
jgi:hypothetical protein